MKYICFLILGILLGCFLTDTRKVNLSHEVSIANLMDSTVALVDLERQHVYCAGVWVSSDEILTAGHCVHDMVSINYLDYRDFTSGNFGSRVGIVTRVSNSDLALIKVLFPDRGHGVVSISDSDIVAGMEGHIIGHPVGQVYTYMKGWVSSIRYRGGVYYLQVQAPIFMGNSGGGMFDRRGNLMGICSSISLLAPSTGYLVSHREIQEFLVQ